MVSSKEQSSITAAGANAPTLPPSVEAAYKEKCIQLKRRMNEVEENNDTYRLRKDRLVRGIRKMRLERAILLEILGKRMRKHSADSIVNGSFDENNNNGSDGSSEGPPTPQEKPLRSKRGHRPPARSPHSASTIHHQPIYPHPTPHFQHQSSSFSTPVAPHPGHYLQTNGSTPHTQYQVVPGSTFLASSANLIVQQQHPILVTATGLPAPPPRPLPPMDLFIAHMMRDVIPEAPQLYPQGLTIGEMQDHCVGLWNNLNPHEAGTWQRRYEETIRDWEAMMRGWEAEAAVAAQRRGNMVIGVGDREELNGGLAVPRHDGAALFGKAAPLAPRAEHRARDDEGPYENGDKEDDGQSFGERTREVEDGDEPEDEPPRADDGAEDVEMAGVVQGNGETEINGETEMHGHHDETSEVLGEATLTAANG